MASSGTSEQVYSLLWHVQKHKSQFIKCGDAQILFAYPSESPVGNIFLMPFHGNQFAEWPLPDDLVLDLVFCLICTTFLRLGLQLHIENLQFKSTQCYQFIRNILTIFNFDEPRVKILY